MFEFIFDFFDKILAMADSFKSFLLSSVTIAGTEISVWALLGGSVFAGILIAILIKIIV